MELVDAAGRQYEPTYRLAPHKDKRFYAPDVRRCIAEVVDADVGAKPWRGEDEGILTVALCDAVSARVKSLGYDRYKLFVQVFLGENRDQGIRVGSRCLWDTESDNWASYSLKNGAGIWVTVLVFGLYVD